VGIFDEPLVTLVHQLKFGRAWEVADVLAPFVYQAMVRVAEETGVTVDRVVPVPLHWTRRAKRGFNQAEELARAVGKLAGWEMADVLWRKRRTAEQAMTASPAERRENMRGAFGCRAEAGRRVGGKHVWLLDDVSTTGATLCAAANALRKLPSPERPASINAAVVCVTDREKR
jgi:ComF family protein